MNTSAIIKDPSLPKKPLSAFALFIKDTFGGSVQVPEGFKELPATEKFRVAVSLWKGLSEAKKAV
jgi:hypothetical protein